MNLKEHYPHACQIIENAFPKGKMGQDQALLFNLVINIDNNLKLKKLMAKIDELQAAAAAENETIKQLAGAVQNLATGYQDLHTKLDALIFQGTNVEPVTAQQLLDLSNSVAAGKQLASDALATAQAVLNPAPIQDPTPAPDPIPEATT